MLRRLAVLCLAILPFAASCGSQPLITVGTQPVVVEPHPNSSNQRADVGYTIGAPAHVTISLVKPDGQRILLRDSDRSPDSYSFPFSGLVDVPNSSDKQVLQNGDYKLLFAATGKDGRTLEQTVPAIIKNADPVPLVVDNLSLSLTTFSPNGQGVQQMPDGTTINQDQTKLNYSVNKTADIAIWVTDSHGTNTPVHQQSAPDTKPGVQPSVTWDGKGANGAPVPDGVYTMHVQATDAAGNVTDRTIQVTVVDSGIPQVQIVSSRFFPMALGLGDTVNLAITIKNTGTTAIKTLGPPPGTIYTTKMKGYLDSSFAKPGDPTPYLDTPGRWRVGVRWTSGDVNYPARWGFFADDTRQLQPNEQVTITGGIKVLAPQPPNINLWSTIDQGGIGNTGDYGQTRVTVAQTG